MLAGIVLWVVAVAPGGPGTGAAAVAAERGQGAYAFTPGAAFVEGAAQTADARQLKAGRTYRSYLPEDGKLYYRLELTAATTAYVPVTAVPPAGSTVSATDGIRVSLQDANGGSCSYSSASFGAGLSPRPVTALGQRDTGRTLCQGAGTYYLFVERLDAEGSGSTANAPARRWDLEIAPATEPRPAAAGSTTAPRAWDSASPAPLGGEPRDQAGGAGFTGARPLGQGVWRTRLAPGRTLFYKVPLDWGRQLHATAELGSTPDHQGYVGGALNLSLYNPARGYVDDVSLGYTGTQKAAALSPLPPVEYANRYAVIGRENSVRFAGDYYLVVHLSERMAAGFGQGPFDVTLRVRVDGRAHGGPEYDGRSVPGDLFTLSPADGWAAAGGGGGSAGTGTESVGSGGTAMTALAAGGIGTGTALLLVLGGWTVAARRNERTRRGQTRASAQKPTA
ncbi:hypothetical protein OIB37_19195 [Streptomyces sp. NBC_00820]|uniref:hypothetical protein n=1 Tax=Streptomyces sp. NBC_00820 TaxID=2975842 RepID=UPI002ED511CD|nr:hypothetical protein OIB37_19195 [Streptomyces sp. NBC_00820]